MTRALIVYCTLYGAIEMTAKEIVDVFHQEGLDTRVVNLKDEKDEKSDVKTELAYSRKTYLEEKAAKYNL